MFTKSQHAKNECLFFNRGKNAMVNLVIMGDVVRKNKRNLLQFVYVLAFATRLSFH
jgi:hypothetical protein